jgi:hypothetical protein
MWMRWDCEMTTLAETPRPTRLAVVLNAGAALSFCLLVMGAFPGCGPAPSGTAVAGKVSYQDDVRPIVQQFCRCHIDNVSPPAGLNLTGYDSMFKSSISGRQIIPAQPDSSNLYRKVARGEMPPTGKLADEDIKVIRNWIKQGARE